MNWRQLDSIDRSILTVLQEHGRVTNVELAEKVGLSPSPCLVRMKALEEEGFIRRYVGLLNPRAVGLSVSVFVQVSLDRQVEPGLTAFENAISKRTEVMECYLMTGISDYLLRVVVADLDEYQEFVTEFLSKVPGVGSIRSSVALKQVKYKTALPLHGQRSATRERMR
jgi:Lrp/AsnC family leucine-responsive transcriptional regulator